MFRIPLLIPVLSLCSFLLPLDVAHADPTPSGKHWVELTGCTLMETAYADGDSFHIQHAGKEYIIRLYFVDSPEPYQVGGFHERTTAQAKYFGIYKKDLYTIADQASTFTSAQLKDKPFTVWTCWLDARGQSRLPRYFGIVLTAENQDLAELLVDNGLARVYGAPADPPFASLQKIENDLRKADEKARKKKAGAWGYSKKK
jgi:endonuclease YncB( thermonuclease family)